MIPTDICGNVINNIFLSGLMVLFYILTLVIIGLNQQGKGTFNFYLQGSVSPNPTYNNF